MNKGTEDFILTAGSILFGAWVIKKLFEGGEYDKCPRCNNPLIKGTLICPNCGQPIKWE